MKKCRYILRTRLFQDIATNTDKLPDSVWNSIHGGVTNHVFSALSRHRVALSIKEIIRERRYENV